MPNITFATRQKLHAKSRTVGLKERRMPGRKYQKYVAYDVLADIPRKIKAQREKRSPNNRKGSTILVRNELLIQTLLALVWRPRNIRECRIGTRSLGANLYKAPIPESTVAI